MSTARRLAVLGVVFGCLALSACSGTAPAAESTPPSATYNVPPETLRPSEVPLQVPTKPVGDTDFTLIALTTGLASLIGSHAEWPATGQFVRVRLIIVNTGRSTVSFDTSRQQMITTDGVSHTPDNQAMQIKRQPSTPFDLGADVRVEFDLYWDIPPDAKPAKLRVFGGPTFSDPTDSTGTEISLGSS